jgi:acetyl-CoA decarbonylase/synthase complex subunit epsilon
MSATLEPWQRAEIPGPKKALGISKPEVVSAMVKREKRVLLVVGSEAPNIETKDGYLVDSAIRLVKTGKVQIAATAHLLGEFTKRRSKGIFSIPLFNLGDRLRDPEWKGLDGKGSYGLVLLVGFPYYYEWLLLSGLKHFATGLRTVSLGRFYQPNAGWSFPNTSSEKWREHLDKIIGDLEVSD